MQDLLEAMEEIRDLQAKLDLAEERFREAFQSYQCFSIPCYSHCSCLMIQFLPLRWANCHRVKILERRNLKFYFGCLFPCQLPIQLCKKRLKFWKEEIWNLYVQEFFNIHIKKITLLHSRWPSFYKKSKTTHLPTHFNTT